MVFKFTIPGQKRSKKPERPAVYQTPVSQEPAIQPIQGVTPGSVQEWRVALALSRLRLSFEYQKPIGGGRRVRGGQVIDFWVNTTPYPTPVFVQGEYWHNRQTENEDNLKQQRVQRAFKGQVMGNVLLKESDLQSAQMAYETVRRALA